MPRKPIDSLLRSKILVAFIAAVLLFFGVLQLAQGLIETRDYRAQIIQAIKEQTGKDVVIRGRDSVSLLPTPTLYLPGVELRDAPSKTPTPTLTVEMLHIHATFLSLFSGQPEISGIVLQKPVLEIERAPDKKIYWDWLNVGLLTLLPASGASRDIEISDGKILYRSSSSEEEIAVENINASGSGGEMKGGFSVGGYEPRFSLNTQGGAGSEMPLNLTVSMDENNTAKLEGRIHLAGDMPTMEATLNVDIEDLSRWMQAKAPKRENLFSQITNEAVPKAPDNTVLPLKLSGKWLQDGWNIKLAQLQLNGLGSEGSGELGLSWTDQLHIGADMNFSVLDYPRWKGVTLKLFEQKNRPAAYYGGEEQPENPLPADVQLSLNLTAQKVTTEGQEWREAQLSATLDKAAITVNQFHIQLPGESNLTLFGIVSQQGGTKGLRFEGSMETQGKSLRNTLTVFDASAADLPETGFGDFYARSNIFVSSEQVRLSEADVKIDDLHLSGGLAAYFDSKPRVEADVRLKDINFDYFRDAWRQKQKDADPQALFLAFDKNMKFGWLNRFSTTVDFKVNVDQFTFLERKGDSASFRLFAKEGQFGIYNVRFNYPNETMEASFNIALNGERPMFNVIFNTSEINTNYFSVYPDKALAAPQPEEASAKPKWPEDLIDMGWMEGVGGVFDISVGKLTHHHTVVNNLKLKAQLENNAMAVQSLSFDYWQGRVEATGSLYGGKVPGFSVGFTLYDAELHDVLDSLTGRKNITGKTSVSGTVTTSGVNYLSWVSQAEAKLVMAARGVAVRGFNLQGAVDAVAVARTAADVVNNVNLAVVNGSTEFSVDGNINVGGGSVRTPGITLKTDAITGNLTGEVKLVPWTINLSTFFQFPAMTSETVPTMTVQLAGPLDAPSLQVDTSSLEAYVAKRIIGR